MKTINYTGSSKLIARIVNLLNRKAPLPLDGNGDPDWGSNGQVLSTDGLGSTAWVNQGGGGGGGHTIVDAGGTDMTQRTGLAFSDAHVSDDSVNDETVVEITESISKAAWDLLDETDPSNNGLYEIDLGANDPILEADEVGFDNSTLGLTAQNAQDAIDEIGTNIKDRTLLCTVTPTNTSVAPYSLLEAASHFMFIELLVGWQGGDIPVYTNDTVWSSGYWNTNDYGDSTRLYTNNNPSNSYAEISSKTDTGCNVKVNNVNVRVAIYGLCRI